MPDPFLPSRAAHFEALYQGNPDPWNYGSSAYEREKYAATLAALPDRRFQNTLELGCSIGVFSQMLAQRSGQLTGIDLSASAIATARQRLNHLPGVRLICGTLPRDWPEGCWDLIVLSEILYYLSPEERRDLCKAIVRSAAPGADVIMVNWQGETGTPWSGAEAAADVTALLTARAGTLSHPRICRKGFAIDRLTLG